MIAAGQVIPLRPSGATLTLFTAGQLFQSPVHFFDLLTHVTRIFRHLRGHSLIQIIGNDPVNVAVWGN